MTAPPREPTFKASGGPLDRHGLVRAGVFAWSVVGLCAVLILFVLLLAMLKLVVVPLVIALFPAALLSPISGRLKARGVPPLTAAALVLVVFLMLLLGLLSELV